LHREETNKYEQIIYESIMVVAQQTKLLC